MQALMARRMKESMLVPFCVPAGMIVMRTRLRSKLDIEVRHQDYFLFFVVNVAMSFVVIKTYLYTSLSGVYLQRLFLRYVVRAICSVPNVPRA